MSKQNDRQQEIDQITRFAASYLIIDSRQAGTCRESPNKLMCENPQRIAQKYFDNFHKVRLLLRQASIGAFSVNQDRFRSHQTPQLAPERKETFGFEIETRILIRADMVDSNRIRNDQQKRIRKLSQVSRYLSSLAAIPPSGQVESPSEPPIFVEPPNYEWMHAYYIVSRDPVISIREWVDQHFDEGNRQPELN